MKDRYHRLLLMAFGLAAPATAWAQRTLQVDLGPRIGLVQLATNIINFLARSIGFIAIALFMIGALMIAVSRGEDPMLSRGKDLVIYSLIGAAVVLGSFGIIRTIFYLIYEG